MNFIDIHCHILPGIDDGPSDMEESLQLIEIAEKDGIHAIFATPHIIKGAYDNSSSSIIASVDELKKYVPDTIKIFYGADVRITLDLLERVESREIPTLNGSGYMLIEMPEYIVPPLVDNLIFNLRHSGIIPIITHPERHLRLMNDLQELRKLRDSGAMCQLTAMSITGGFGKVIQKVSIAMIKKGLADFVASDAHDPEKRRPVLSTAYKQVKKEFGNNVADRLFFVNPGKILEAATPANLS